MAYREPYDEDYENRGRQRRDHPGEEGFFDRIRDWFRERVSDRPSYQDVNRDRNRDYDRSVRVYDQGNDTNFAPRRSYRSNYNQDVNYNRDYDSGSGLTYGDRENNPEWERTRQWRRDYNHGPDNRRGEYRDRYNQRYGSGWEDEMDYKENYNRYRRDADWDYDPYRDYGSNRNRFNNRERYSDREHRHTGYSRNYEPDYGGYSHRNYNRDFTRVYPAAGMGAGYDARPGDRYRNDYDDNVNYGEGDVGYKDSGAFYQDLDEPTNYEAQDYSTISGHEPVTGSFFGIGPQSYQRTDERIQEDVCERLTRHGWVDASDIAVQVVNGEVILQGTVPDRSMKRIAEDVTENIGGVRDVRNEIKVNRRSGWHNQRGVESSWESRWPREAEAMAGEVTEQAGESLASQTTTGAGLTTQGAIDLEGAEPGVQASENYKGVLVGMEVIGADARVVGRVKELRAGDFLVDRELARDVYVPFSAVNNAGEQVLLNVSADEVDNQDWEKPSLI